MTFPLEYHDVVKCPVQRPVSGLAGLFGVPLLVLVLVSSSPAQINSATASGGSGHSMSVAPPTGSIAPPTGRSASVAPPTAAPFIHNGFATSSWGNNHSAGSAHHSGQHHHRGNNAGVYPYYYPYWYGAPVPYADATDADNEDDEDDPEYQGGPTVFDRRGSGEASYVPPSYPGPAHRQPQVAQETSAQGEVPPESDSQPAVEPPPPATILVFKDGHQLEVDNYAIVSQTLYDLTRGHPRKIALADLDLPATQKQNEDHGVSFQLPPLAQAN
jgi:hypothetical protein